MVQLQKKQLDIERCADRMRDILEGMRKIKDNHATVKKTLKRKKRERTKRK